MIDEVRQLGPNLGDRFDIAVRALSRLADHTEIAGMGDVEDPEGLARVALARRALADLGLSHKKGGGPLTTPTDDPADKVTTLPDLSDTPLSELLTVDNPHLADSLRRVVEEDDERDGVVAGFQSAI